MRQFLTSLAKQIQKRNDWHILIDMPKNQLNHRVIISVKVIIGVYDEREIVSFEINLMHYVYT